MHLDRSFMVAVFAHVPIAFSAAAHTLTTSKALVLFADAATYLPVTLRDEIKGGEICELVVLISVKVEKCS
eukprot:6189540-Pleurochrysis_carterae.AAC.1